MDIIKQHLELPQGLSTLSTIREANLFMGLSPAAGTPLPEQAQALLDALGIQPPAPRCDDDEDHDGAKMMMRVMMTLMMTMMSMLLLLLIIMMMMMRLMMITMSDDNNDDDDTLRA